jgi:hypothetical protein
VNFPDSGRPIFAFSFSTLRIACVFLEKKNQLLTMADKSFKKDESHIEDIEDSKVQGAIDFTQNVNAKLDFLRS